jgi:hypothetical protein
MKGCSTREDSTEKEARKQGEKSTHTKAATKKTGAQNHDERMKRAQHGAKILEQDPGTKKQESRTNKRYDDADTTTQDER